MKLIIKTSNPFDYNSVVARQMEDKETYTPTASSMLENPVLNTLGKFLGLNTKTDWNKYSDKLFAIYNWAVNKVGSKDVNRLISVIKKKINSSPKMAERRIDDLYIAIRLDKKPLKVQKDPMADYYKKEEIKI